MNKDQIEGAVKDAAGKVQRKVGEIVGSDKQQIKGAERQIKGEAQQKVGNAKELIKDATK